MKEFFKMFFASLLAMVFVGAVGVFLMVGFIVAAGASAKPQVPAKAVLVFDLSMNIPDHPGDPGPGEALAQLAGDGEKGVPLATVVSTLQRAATDEHIAALYLTGNPVSQNYGSGLAALKEVREALQAFSKSGKPVIAYNMVWDKKAYYVAAGAASLTLHPMGEVDLTGLASEPMFFGEAFKKYGVEVQVTRVGKYKSAVEPFISDRMSEPNREQVAKLLGDLWSHWKTEVAIARNLSPETIQALADEKGMLVGEEARTAGLVDAVAPFDTVLEQLKQAVGQKADSRDFPQIAFAQYADLSFASGPGKRVAVLYAEGDIVDGDGKPGQVGGDHVARELRKLRLDKHVKAVVLRVNSPGGSAMASEVIQREMVLTAQVKPVAVSMGYLAASGGYWISAYGQRIFAEPTTITGSIGVFGILPNVKKLANEHGITFDSVQTAKLANPMTLARPKTEAELARIQQVVDGIYDQFLTKVAEGRKLPRERVHEIAQGRVWSGAEALKLGLVDELGGLQDAAAWAAKQAGLGKDWHMDLPGPRKPPFQQLMEALGKEDHPTAGLVKVGGLDPKGPVGRLWSDVQRQMLALSALNDPQGVYARMPLDLQIQ
jgi:protease-4